MGKAPGMDHAVTCLESVRLPLRFRTGVDVVPYARVERLRGNEAALACVFHPRELARGDSAHLAGCVAVKEAVCKALGFVPPRWLEITVRADAGDRPRLSFSPDLGARIVAADCSVSHDGGVAVATVLLELRECTLPAVDAEIASAASGGLAITGREDGDNAR